MTFYTDMQAVSDSMLKQYGQSISLSHNTYRAYNPATGSTQQTTATEVGFGAIFEYTRTTDGIQQADGTLISTGDKKLLLSPVGISAPTLNDSVTVSGISYVIKNIKSLNPAGIVVLYECQLSGV